MVELTEIKEEEVQTSQQQQVPIVETVVPKSKQDSEDLSDDEYDSEFDDDFNENETFWERISALKDIIPPKQRQNFSNFVNGTNRLFKSIVNKSGSFTWAITTSALLLGGPLSLSILAEHH
ncbi:hypothetical protein Kpol_505p24 [Vanderwaltozyma polyspora DSM 70294]|uniref:Mitochondrial import receptor subunit TOM22 n=1 Tax=Vanderwaltozyma polyspora (strain ATCC 22028 / DSM 70294 / BCRC 21397 / CBS 2163 / NBRC 10782 / NRRL Y-8283 / UCD 57-17) TaxID=436907 RepID=A7TNB5_VANPO|nr:uncharacterized protein Kpol_505p24 [Vanderwaltozyma polyspora DSM 70294]EDO16247.1 hypothetical protein Kpol_505p24 [Vanderwaltozyma polyspora DSM 70294]